MEARFDRGRAQEERVGEGVTGRAETHLVDRAVLGEQVKHAAHLLAVSGGEVDPGEAGSMID